MMALDASFALKSADGSRQIAARAFLPRRLRHRIGRERAADRDSNPGPPPRAPACPIQKIKRKVGDYAIAAAAVTLSMAGGKCTDAAIALTNVGDTALLSAAAADAITGTPVDANATKAAAEAAMADCSPAEDLRGPVEYRRAMAGTDDRSGHS